MNHWPRDKESQKNGDRTLGSSSFLKIAPDRAIGLGTSDTALSLQGICIPARENDGNYVNTRNHHLIGPS